ncbi:MAG: 50S ribosomal protein L1 [Candidatus Omnitrophica bacterium CG11_big_fil_rev_8_21_14_0_20_42_13]|uniref:Large ribosomal subunit protein uL1 n=1 Tax=Candidatus Ghiorseimicrobium undicola TaxID=1974746 RepID=A0A2H0LVE0_9BACT|nr:MAG: 50S ribosomal protein L1 [Candidatus Omnitrophica bacterium CG11_big_fil_rev_8_21_14_0_20_42_13]
MNKHSKRFKEALKLTDLDKYYTLKEAVGILKKVPPAKFNESVDVAFNLNIDPKKSDQMVRGTVILPHGVGKKVRIAVFCKGEAEKEARQAGADFFGSQELIDKVLGGWMDFDVAVATPDIMKDVSRLGKVLGPRGLMPSPKTGTVTNNIAQAIKEIKAGKVEFKVDKQSGIHCSVGKISFDENKLYDNASKFIDTVLAAKPASVKGKFVKSVSISTTMGIGIKIEA